MRSVFAKTILILSLLFLGKSAVFAQGIVTESDSVAWKEHTFWKDGEQYTEKYCVASDSAKHGPYLLFDERGNIVTIANYQNNELHGEFWGLLPVRLGMYHQLGRYEYGQKKGWWKEKYLPPLQYRIKSFIVEEVKYYTDRQQLTNDCTSYEQRILKPLLPESLSKVKISEGLKN